MSKNYVQYGNRLTFPKSSLVGPNNPIKSGDACVIGRICGIAAADAVPGSAGPADDSNVVVELFGVFSVSVTSAHHTGVTAGETVYINASTGAVSDDNSGVPFGVALDAVTLGSTSAIRVRLFGATPGATGANS